MEFHDVYDELQNISVFLNVFANALNECEVSQFNNEELSACFYHLNSSLDYCLKNLLEVHRHK